MKKVNRFSMTTFNHGSYHNEPTMTYGGQEARKMQSSMSQAQHQRKHLNSNLSIKSIFNQKQRVGGSVDAGIHGINKSAKNLLLPHAG